MKRELAERITGKCLSIYERKRTLRAVFRFLDRLDLPGSSSNELWEQEIRPAIRREFFLSLSVDSFFEEILPLCRSAKKPGNLLSGIWNRLDDLPFDYDEYSEFVDRIEEAFKRLPNPPSRDDWDDLEEHLRK